MSFCSKCGKEIEENANFCPGCGCTLDVAASEETNDAYYESGTSGRIKASYFFSIFGAIISFFVRIINQQTYIYWENLLDNKKVIGLDKDTKPLLTAIPVIAAIIVSLLIVSDKQTDSQRKLTAFIVNAIFILLSVLFIWFDIPSAIIDF